MNTVSRGESIEPRAVPIALLRREGKRKHHVLPQLGIEQDRAVGFQRSGEFPKLIAKLEHRHVTAVILARLVQSSPQTAGAGDQVVIDKDLRFASPDNNRFTINNRPATRERANQDQEETDEQDSASFFYRGECRRTTIAPRSRQRHIKKSASHFGHP